MNKKLVVLLDLDPRDEMEAGRSLEGSNIAGVVLVIFDLGQESPQALLVDS